MPVIDDVMDVPVPEWCSASDAVLWIMLKRPPVAFHHVVLVKDGALSLGLDAEGRSVRDNPNYFQSWAKLYEAGRQGIVGLRGRPAIGLQKIVFGPPMMIEIPGLSPNSEKSGDCKETHLPLPSFQCEVPPTIQCEKWGDLEVIPPAKLKEAGNSAFLNVERVHFLSDGMMYASEYYPPTAWAYDNIEINTLQLIRCFHPAEGKELRVGTEVNFLQPEEPQENSSAKAVLGPILREYSERAECLNAMAAPSGTQEQLPLDIGNEAHKQIAAQETPSRGQGGGKPPHLATEVFIREFIRFANEKGGLPRRRGELSNRMKDRLAVNYDGKMPGDTTIKGWIRRFDWPEHNAQRKILSRSQGGSRSPHAAPDVFIRELVRLADQDGLPEEPGALLNHMMDWAAQNYDGDAPPDTTIEEWLQLCVGRKKKS